MRAELALIAGILFFCCWCAYIVSKMNASVASAPLLPGGAGSALSVRDAPDAWRESAGPGGAMGPAPGFGLGLGELHNYQKQQQVASGQYNQYNNQQQQQSPLITHQQLTASNQQPQPASLWPPAAQLANQMNQVQPAAYASAAGHNELGPEVAPQLGRLHYPQPALEGRWQPQWSAAITSDCATGTCVASEPTKEEDGEEEAAPATGGTASDDDAATPAEEATEAHDNDEPSRPADDGGGGGGGGGDGGDELDEGGQRRSFSERRADGRERDRNGRLVATWRRHLVNGQPVIGVNNGSSSSNSATGKAIAPEPRDTLADEAANFERLVDEIDTGREEADEDDDPNQEQPQEAASSPNLVASRRQDDEAQGVDAEETDEDQAAQGWPSGANGGATTTTSKKPADHHEHRLHETLSARQWDDDVHQGDNGNQQPPTTDSQVDRSDEQSADDEAQKLEQLGLELIGAHDSDAPTSNSRSRKRRHAAPPGASSGRLVSGAAGAAGAAAPAVTNKTADGRAPQQKQPPQLDATSQLVGRPEASGELQVPLEDISVELLAPVPHRNASSSAPTAPQLPVFRYYQLPGAGPAVAPMAPATGPQLHVAGFPRVSSPFASASRGLESKVSGRRKKRRKSATSQQKYKAARAHEAHKKSKRKKGKMYKKKHGLAHKSSGSSKHFKGSTRGHKTSKGSGRQGANKGAKLLKDKGYKKRGFKKVYHKLETGDHKTYFDEFRDKDHKNKWNKHDDFHKYSKRKKYTGADAKHLKHHKLAKTRSKSSKDGQWSEKATDKRIKDKEKWSKLQKEKSDSLSENKKETKKKKRKKKKRTQM